MPKTVVIQKAQGTSEIGKPTDNPMYRRNFETVKRLA